MSNATPVIVGSSGTPAIDVGAGRGTPVQGVSAGNATPIVLVSNGRGLPISFVGGTFFFLGGSLPPGATLTRASTGWYFDSSGVLQSASTDVARFTHNPGTLALEGLLVEPAATNSIRNASAGGAVPGTPGTAPTNWVVTSSLNNVTREIIGTGTEDGIPYIDVKYSGTPNATATIAIRSEATSIVAATLGQTWVAGQFVRLVGGTLTNLTNIATVILEANSGGIVVASGSAATAPTSAALRTQWFKYTRVLSNVTVAFVAQDFRFTHTNGQAIDATFRIGLPQLVQAPAASSPIVTTSAAITRAADVLSLALVDGTYSIDITRASGVTNLTGVAVSGGSYTVPTDVSPLQSVIARRTA